MAYQGPINCAWCRGPLETPSDASDRLRRCTRCGRESSAGPHPRLTAPHRCPVSTCGQRSINPVLNRRVTTLRHEECLATVTLYASLYRCPFCLTAELLESPRHQWGQIIACPVRPDHEVTVPDDLILRDVTDDASDRFAFDCPACSEPLACARRWARRWAVCTGCLLAIQVPDAGLPLSDDDPDGVPPPSVGMGASILCSGCGRHYPRRCAGCPSCSRG